MNRVVVGFLLGIFLTVLPLRGLEFSANPTTEEIFRARVFEEPLVPIGGKPRSDENAALAAALLDYTKRAGPDDFSSLTGFLKNCPRSPWRAALLTSLGLEYYNTAHYSLTLDAWEEAWQLAKDAPDAKGKALADRAAGELAYMYARLGRMTELDALLKSVEGRGFIGGATERITGAREGLWNMQNKPEISFKCGPYALQQILMSKPSSPSSPPAGALLEIFNFPSTQKGVSLPQVAELSKKVGLNYQMAFREKGVFIVPSVVHWKVGHYAALVRQEGDKFVLEDPTFGNTVWATREALEAETSGYFLIPPENMPRGWRTVDGKEGGAVWGKGQTGSNDSDAITQKDLQTGSCGADGVGMAVSSVHLMTVNISIKDTPVGYTPPVGPPVRFTIRYNSRDPNQPANFHYSNFGPKWTCDWIAYIMDNPFSLSANVKYYALGGGARRYEGFDTNTQAFAVNDLDQTRLTRTSISPISYQLLQPDGSKLIFSQSGGTVGSVRKVFLTRMEDPAGNALTLGYDGLLRLVTVTDAIGQVTTLDYGLTDDVLKVTKVTDPFGRFATLNYSTATIGWNYQQTDEDCPPHIGKTPVTDIWLSSVTDVLGLVSQFHYLGTNQAFFCVTCPTNPAIRRCETNQYAVDFIASLTTPYGTTSFSGGGGVSPNLIRFAESVYPDGSRERVEFNHYNTNGVTEDLPSSAAPVGIIGPIHHLVARNTYYWSRSAAASSYGDHSKARIYHWFHRRQNLNETSSILESTKEPLENRVFYNYPGQVFSDIEGFSSTPTKIGRVLDDGQTQLYTMGYNSFGKLTNSIDPVGRTLSFVYATNGIDLVEVRQTRAGNNELLFSATYNAQHLPLTVVHADGRANTYTYNARGQLLTDTNAKGEGTAYTYTADGFLSRVDGPLPGTNDTLRAHHDIFGHVQTLTGVTGYMLTFDYDKMDRVTRITHPDGTFEEFTYDRLDVSSFRDRAGRLTFLEHDAIRQLKKQTDPLGRVTRFEWCRCGQIKSLTDPMGQTTTWLTDVQGRPIAKQYADGSQIKYQYENSITRLRFAIDQKQQVTQFAWNRDNTLQSFVYGNALIPTPGASFQYDPNYERVVSMTDGTGTTRYSYNAVMGTPTLGAGGLASVDGPLPNDTITYAYDELNRPIHGAINGVGSTMNLDAAGRLVGLSNALGSFVYDYDGSTIRLVSRSFPNGQTEARSHDNSSDRKLQRITHTVGGTPISEFLYGHDVAKGRITTWSQQVGATPPSLYTFGYDSGNQLLSANVTNSGNLVSSFAYAYDLAGNRLAEQAGMSNYTATYDALNEIKTTTAPGMTRSNEWDAANRLVAVNMGNQRTEFTYDGLGRRVAIRKLLNGSEVSLRRFVWRGGEISEERNAASEVTKRYFPQGVKIEIGPATGTYFYARDHLGSIRELTDSNGNVRARYAYDPYGRRTKLAGDLDADFGFAGMFWSAEVNLSLAQFRAYDPELGRWLSRDPLPKAELLQGPNLYAYVHNVPTSRIDPEGLADSAKIAVAEFCATKPGACQELIKDLGYGTGVIGGVKKLAESNPGSLQCAQAGLPEIEAAVPALEAEIGALENTILYLERVELVVEAPALRPIAHRITDLGNQFRTTITTLDFQILRQHGFMTDDLYAVETEFSQIVWDLHILENVSWHQAWQWLANFLEFNPRLWGQ